eukprot:6277568-Prymnesium_polylepis.1
MHLLLFSASRRDGCTCCCSARRPLTFRGCRLVIDSRARPRPGAVLRRAVHESTSPSRGMAAPPRARCLRSAIWSPLRIT